MLVLARDEAVASSGECRVAVEGCGMRGVEPARGGPLPCSECPWRPRATSRCGPRRGGGKAGAGDIVLGIYGRGRWPGWTVPPGWPASVAGPPRGSRPVARKPRPLTPTLSAPDPGLPGDFARAHARAAAPSRTRDVCKGLPRGEARVRALLEREGLRKGRINAGCRGRACVGGWLGGPGGRVPPSRPGGRGGRGGGRRGRRGIACCAGGCTARCRR